MMMLKVSRRVFKVYKGPNDIASERTSKILDRLNSLNSAAEITSVIEMYAGQRVFGKRIAQRILNTKVKIGEFQDLQQVATVPGIGPKRFAIFISALGDHL